MRVRPLVLLVSALLAGCAAAPPPASPEPLLAGHLFGPPREAVRTDDVFAVSDAMRRFLAIDVAAQLRTQGPQAGLAMALHEPAQLKLEYDAARTKNAAATFAERTGNCLSLVIMTAAFAKELRLPVIYQVAYLDESWGRSGDLLVSSGHINLTLERRLFDSRTQRDLNPMTVDFLPPDQIAGLHTREVGEATVIAMYANNRSAEALAEGRLDDAYAWAAESVRRDPGFSTAYNTLGVVYLRHGNLAEAERSFAHVLAADAKDPRALANVAETYQRQGRVAEAAAMRQRLASIETYPPFHFFHLGMAAMQRQEWREARELFAREVARTDGNHEAHFWLGVADWHLGEEKAALRHLTLAIDNSLTRDQLNLYAAKLAWLQAHRHQ